MGQGTSKYRKITRTPQTGENAGKKLWYATAVSDREMSFEDFVTHISEHNSPYSRGTIHGVLMDTLDCLKHLILDGKSVRFSDLGLFSIGMTSRGEVSKEKVTAASVLGVHLIVRNTKTWSNAELKKLTKIVAYDDYTTGAEDGGGTENTPGGGNTSQGAGGVTNKDNGGLNEDANRSSLDANLTDWLFAEGRQPGDAAVVEASDSSGNVIGYQILYVESLGEIQWKYQATTALRSDDYDKWYTEVEANYPAELTDLGKEIAASSSNQ